MSDAVTSSPPTAPALSVEDEAALLDAFLQVRTREEVRVFLADLCTPSEVRAFVERWKVVRLLEQGKSYREIAELAGASTTTVTRVSRFLREMPYRGYRLVLDRLNGKTS